MLPGFLVTISSCYWFLRYQNGVFSVCMSLNKVDQVIYTVLVYLN